MRAKLRRRPKPIPVLAGAAAVLTLGLAACMPGGLRVGFGGVSISSNGGLGFGMGGMGRMGGLFNLASQGNSSGGSQYSLPTSVEGPRETAATFHNEVACEDRIGLNFGPGFTTFDPEANAPGCFSCPEGYERTGTQVPPADAFACRQAGGGLFQSAESLGPPGCGEGTFQIDEACYSCPADMTPTGNADPGTACLAVN
jgi:hypothetical protein